jgi:hypothetical protein
MPGIHDQHCAQKVVEACRMRDSIAVVAHQLSQSSKNEVMDEPRPFLGFHIEKPRDSQKERGEVHISFRNQAKTR